MSSSRESVFELTPMRVAAGSVSKRSGSDPLPAAIVKRDATVNQWQHRAVRVYTKLGLFAHALFHLRLEEVWLPIEVFT